MALPSSAGEETWAFFLKQHLFLLTCHLAELYFQREPMYCQLLNQCISLVPKHVKAIVLCW